MKYLTPIICLIVIMTSSMDLMIIIPISIILITILLITKSYNKFDKNQIDNDPKQSFWW